jgi:hypothetical protein
MILPASPNRDEVLRFLAASVSYGNLGLFVGAGFSKAVLNEGWNEIALSWGPLLEKTAEKLGVKYESISHVGMSYPEIASAICKEYCKNHSVTFPDALKRLKENIAALTSWYPTEQQQTKYKPYIEAFSPSWIITTNYDLVIETLLTGKSIPRGPNDSLSAPKGIVPVFHLHGLRTTPDEIIIAQEDYVTLFRPTQYRQIKLSLTIRESTTLVIGYGLGDVNVLTALDWSSNVFKAERTDYPHGVIQVLRTGTSPAHGPYRLDNDIVVVETDELSSFFDEFILARKVAIQEEEERTAAIQDFANQLISPSAATITHFIDNGQYRSQVLKALSNFPLHLVASFIPFMEKCIDETWRRSEPNGAFDAYNQQLIVVLDILTAFPLGSFPPALFHKAAYSLDRVGGYIGTTYGDSWAAHNTWNARKGDLSPEIVKELRHVAEQYMYFRVQQLLE